MTEPRLPRRAGTRPSDAPVELDALVDSVALELRLAHEVSFASFQQRTGGPVRPALYAILRVIRANPGVNVTSLSEAVGRDKSTLSITLKSLVRDGLITQELLAGDRRQRGLFLTASGEVQLSLLAQHAAAHDEALDTIIGDQKPLLLELLRKIRRALDRQDRTAK